MNSKIHHDPCSIALFGRRGVPKLLGGTAVAGVLPALSARAAGAASAALAFNGGALIAAGAQAWRHDPIGGPAALLATPVAPIRMLASHPDRIGRLFAAHDGSGITRSDDGGRSWTVVDDGLPQAQVTALAIAAAAPDTLYATVAEDGLWRSEDAGASWSFVMDRPWIAEAEREVLALASVNLASGMGGIWIYAGTENGMTRVPDCFCRWQDVVAGDAMDALVAGAAPVPEAPLPDGEPILALVSAHTNPELLYAALPSGVWTSTDGGVVWMRANDLQSTALVIDPADETHIITATAAGLTQSRDSGITRRDLATV